MASSKCRVDNFDDLSCQENNSDADVILTGRFQERFIQRRASEGSVEAVAVPVTEAQPGGLPDRGSFSSCREQSRGRPCMAGPGRHIGIQVPGSSCPLPTLLRVHLTPYSSPFQGSCFTARDGSGRAAAPAAGKQNLEIPPDICVSLCPQLGYLLSLLCKGDGETQILGRARRLPQLALC